MDKPVSLRDRFAFSLFYLNDTKSFFNDRVAFLYIVDGRVSLIRGKDAVELGPNDLILLKGGGFPSILHPVQKPLILICSFDPLFFREEFDADFELLQCDSVRHPEYEYPALRAALVSLAFAQSSHSDRSRFLIEREIFHLFHLLQSDFVIFPAAEEEKEPGDRAFQKLGLFFSYLNENFASPISLQSAADYMGYTPQYLASFLKKQIGRTFGNCLNELRLERALDYLKFRDDPVDLISMLCGFANTGSFLRVFYNKYDVAPEQFREDFRRQHTISSEGIEQIQDPSFVLHRLEARTVSALNAERPASFVPAKHLHVACDIGTGTPLAPVWSELIDLGLAENFRNPAFRSHLIMLEEELHFRYGRISDILSLIPFQPAERAQTSVLFGPVFSVIDFMRSIHLTPQIDLSNPLPDLPAYRETVPHLIQPESYEERLRQLLPIFLEACVNRYGRSEVSGWRFELGMEYDIDSMEMTESAETFFNRFSFVCSTIRGIIPEASIGAPGFHSLISYRYLNEILACLSRHNLYPDFLTAYIFPYTLSSRASGKEAEPRVEENPVFFAVHLRRIRGICAANGMSEIPIHVTKFCSVIDRQSHVNDSLHQAAFIAKQFLAGHDRASAYGYWIASDCAVEFPPDSRFLSGGNGLVSRYGIRKPGYFAFQFFSMLGTHLIRQGENYLITRDSDESCQILICHYAHFSGDIPDIREQTDIEQDPESAFADDAPLQIEFDLDGFPDGTYKITHHALTRDHGCVFSEWRRMDCASNLDLLETNRLKCSCVPLMTIVTQEINDRFRLRETVGKNELHLILIRRIS